MLQTPQQRQSEALSGEVHALSPEDLREQRSELERVLYHPEISRSTSLVRFLTYICDRYFEDKASEVREHTIAVKALGRKESTFDSHVDPIVRVTASALRKRLREYYETDGKRNPLEIVIPLGQYVPRFLKRSLAVAEKDVASDRLPSPVEELLVPAPEPFAQAIVLPPRQGPAGRYRRLWIAILVACIAIPATFYAGLLLGRKTHESASEGAPSLQWGDPVWSDEFNGAALQVPETGKWAFDVGNQNNSGNHELGTYCSPIPGATRGCDPHVENAFQDGAGHLVLRASRNANGNWTSARVTTRGIRQFQYGRIEARMKMPQGMGLWPAFWMLGASFPTEGWPAAGAVDIVENVGLTSRSNGLGPTVVRSSLHAPGYAGGNSLRRNYQLANGGRVDDAGFHTYGIIWSPGMIQFYVDDPSNIFFIQNVSDLPEGGKWVFDHPFYLVLNLAVGGDWSGDPDNTTPSPSDMLVDYVRVYRIPTAVPSIEWHPVKVASGSITTSLVTLHGQRGMGRVYLSCSTEPVLATCALNASTVDFTDSAIQQDSFTVSTMGVSQGGGHVVAPPGTYKLTITATNLSGDRAQVMEPFEVQAALSPTL